METLKKVCKIIFYIALIAFAIKYGMIKSIIFDYLKLIFSLALICAIVLLFRWIYEKAGEDNRWTITTVTVIILMMLSMCSDHKRIDDDEEAYCGGSGSSKFSPYC